MVGLSMGGFATLHFGLAYRARRSLVVAGCGYGAEPDKREAVPGGGSRRPPAKHRRLWAWLTVAAQHGLRADLGCSSRTRIRAGGREFARYAGRASTTGCGADHARRAEASGPRSMTSSTG